MDLAIQTKSYSGLRDLSWLRTRKGLNTTQTIQVDLSKFNRATHYPDGVIKCGTVLGQITASEKYGPYGGKSNEVQTVTEGGTGLTSFTLTYSGQTTDDIAPDATAADVQAALEALVTIGAGNVEVTGDASGPYTVTFIGALAETNVDALTSTPTGGTGTVTIATSTAGGAAASGGLDTAAGFLMNDIVVVDPSHVDMNALLTEGDIVEANLPDNSGIDAGAKTDFGVRFRFT